MFSLVHFKPRDFFMATQYTSLIKVLRIYFIFIFVKYSSLIKFQENFLRTPLIHGITKSLKNDLFLRNVRKSYMWSAEVYKIHKQDCLKQ